jgi:hypothetical protein
VALVARDGSIDWLCLPRVDSPTCFAALLGTRDYGPWLIAPAAPPRAVRRRYRGDTLVVETEYEPDDGVVALVDCMPPRPGAPMLVRLVEERAGRCRCGGTSRCGFERCRETAQPGLELLDSLGQLSVDRLSARPASSGLARYDAGMCVGTGEIIITTHICPSLYRIWRRPELGN